MTAIPLGTGAWRRDVARDAEIATINRYFESDPTNGTDQVSLLARPAFEKWLVVGDGPIRGEYSQPGSFDDALFVVSGSKLYRIDTDETKTQVGTGLWGKSLRANVSLAATAAIGSTPEYLFAADGKVLWLYIKNGYALGTLAGTPADDDTVTIGTTVYQWTSGDVDSGTPDGSSGSPWLVDLGDDASEAFGNLAKALDASGTAGETYSTDLDAHASVEMQSYSSAKIVVRALDAGSPANSIVTTETGSDLAWSAATLGGGGDDTFIQVAVPDDLGVKSVAFIAGYVIVVVAQGESYNGRFFWIEPGETIIRPRNFATAEKSPDPAHSVRVIGDQFFLFGSNSTETWYPTGDSATPFQRAQGQVFEAGIWEGTDVQLGDVTVVVDMDGMVWVIGPGGAERLASPGIAERIRKAQLAQLKWEL